MASRALSGRLARAAVLLAAAWGGALLAQAAPDAIYRGGKVVTLDPRSDVAQAFAVKGDRFVAVGADASVMALAGKGTRIVDLKGATVVPGFTDGHDHLWNSAKYQYRGVDMIGVTSLDAFKARLAAAVARAKPGEVVFTTLGWSVPALTRQDLDAISTTVPIAAIRSRQGKGFVNGAALARLGISKQKPVFDGETLPLDKAGEPTGAPPSYPRSLKMMTALLPKMTPAVEDMVVAKAMAQRNALGITSTRELSVWPEGAQALQRMAREGKLTVRMAIGLESPDHLKTGQYFATLPPPDRSDPWLFLDAMAEEPWAPGSAPLPDFIAQIRDVRRLGWRASPHVSADSVRKISYDEATDGVLAGYEAVDREQPLKGRRWMMEHVPFATPAEMDRMAKLGLIVSVQSDGYEPEKPPLGPERMAHQNPVRSFLDHGVPVIGGSDFTSPTADEPEPNNPMIPFYFYVTRRTKDGKVLTPSEKVDRETALRMFTTYSAYATFQEKVKGQVAPGMLADFVILNQDLMTVPEDRILATRPLATFVGGRRVYAAPGAGF